MNTHILPNLVKGVRFSSYTLPFVCLVELKTQSNLLAAFLSEKREDHRIDLVGPESAIHIGKILLTPMVC